MDLLGGVFNKRKSAAMLYTRIGILECTIHYRLLFRFSRLGGATALQYIVKTYPVSLVCKNLRLIVQSLLETQLGLLDEVSSGAVDMAMKALRMLPEVRNFYTSEIHCISLPV